VGELGFGYEDLDVVGPRELSATQPQQGKGEDFGVVALNQLLGCSTVDSRSLPSMLFLGVHRQSVNFDHALLAAYTGTDAHPKLADPGQRSYWAPNETLFVCVGFIPEIVQSNQSLYKL
jgi:hypothetical protein